MMEFIEQIVKEIVSAAGELDPVRRRMFLVWLGDHTFWVRFGKEEWAAESLAGELAAWLGSLAIPGILWEYRLILGEIEWWSAWERELVD